MIFFYYLMDKSSELSREKMSEAQKKNIFKTNKLTDISGTHTAIGGM